MTTGQKEPEGDGGLTLDEALETFVPQKLQDRYRRARDRCPEPYDGDRRALMERDQRYLRSTRALLFDALNRAFRTVWDDLIARLVSGELVGFVFDEYPIRHGSVRRRVPAEMWRQALYLADDVEIDGVLYREARIWRAMDMEAIRSQPNNSSGKAAADCEVWLHGLVEIGAPAKVKAEYRAEALRTFSGLSGRAFDAAWQAATKGRDDWGRPGRKKK